MTKNNLERPNYYGIIPAIVRYDQSISASTKLFYAEISSLTNMSGMCWATNQYFAKLYNVQPTRVSEWVKQLELAGHIKTRRVKGNLRGIELLVNPSGKPEPSSGKPEDSLLENQNHNININNNKKNIKKKNELRNTKSTQSTFGGETPPDSASPPPSKKQDEKKLLDLVNRITSRSFRVFGTKSGVGKTLKAFSFDEVETALKALVQDSWHRPRLKEFSIDYFIRATTIDKFLSQTPSGATPTRVPDHYDDEDGNSYWKGELVTPENQERIMREQME